MVNEQTILTITAIIQAIEAIVLTATVYWAAKQSLILRESMESRTYQRIVERTNILFAKILDHPQSLGPLLVKESESFSPRERTKSYVQQGFMLSLFNLFHLVFLEYAKGNVEEGDWARWKALMSHLFEHHPIYKIYWDNLSAKNERYHTEFVDMINELMMSQQNN